MMTRFLCLGAVAASLLVVAMPRSADAAETTLRLQHFTPPVAAMHRLFLMPWTKRVAAQSNGRLKVDIYPSMQLGGKPRQLIDQIRDGVVDMGWTIPGYTPGRFPKVEVFALPFIQDRTTVINKSLMAFHDMHLRDEFKDYKVLLLHVHAGNAFHMRNKPIRRIEDFKGLKIRTPNRAGSWFLEALGAVPVGSTITEVTQLLSRGVVDGVMVPFEIVWPFKMHEMTKYHIDIAGGVRVSSSIFFFGMNRKRYERLPSDLRKVLDDTTGMNLAPIAGQVWDAAEQPGINAAKKRGNKFIVLSAAETDRMRKVSQAAIDRWLTLVKGKGIDGQKLLTDARALVAKYRMEK
jgi:TRAP-type C4-dicarboxylate transport system substrate-binding protein